AADFDRPIWKPMNLLQSQPLPIPQPGHHPPALGAEIHRQVTLCFHFEKLTLGRKGAEEPQGSSAAFQPAVSQASTAGMRILRVPGNVNGPADWKSAIQQVGNLRCVKRR